jgi:DNA repair protein RadC
LELALRARAKGVIIAHNHPDGKALASNDDVATTSRLAYVLNNSSISLLRHYVVSGRNIDVVEFNIT